MTKIDLPDNKSIEDLLDTVVFCAKYELDSRRDSRTCYSREMRSSRIQITISIRSLDAKPLAAPHDASRD